MRRMKALAMIVIFPVSIFSEDQTMDLNKGHNIFEEHSRISMFATPFSM
jgi:exopolysaccharide biosynthesis predicted pyruvyltransferase EpsI